MRLVVTRILFLFVILLAGWSSFSQKGFDFNARCKQAYHEIMQLKLQSAKRLLDQEKAAHPDNLIPHLLDNYIDFYTLLFNEDPQDLKLKKSALDKRISLINEGPESSPFYLFSKSVIYFQWAAVRMKFGYNWDGGWLFRRSYLLIKDNQEKFPGFSPNLLYNGSMQIAADAIPDGYRWLSNLLGVKGGADKGFKAIESFLSEKDEWAVLFKDEALFYYLFLRYYNKNERKEALEYIRTKKPDVRNNHLFAFLAVNLNVNDQQSENAIRIIKEMFVSPDYLQTPVWDLQMGYALMNRLDDQAPVYFEQYLTHFKGSFYVKDVLQKLSWFYYIKGDQHKADDYRKQLISRGAQRTDADKQAQKEALSGTWPNKLLLQARLLNDGGYFQEALHLLAGKRAIDFTDAPDRLEFYYRVARLYDAVGREEESITFYQQAIKSGEHQKEYYAARSALQLGMVYEKKGDTAQAAYWYRQCLDMKGHDYKNSLDQRAKAGLSRVQSTAP